MVKGTPLAMERNAEEIFNILYSEENSSTLSDKLEGVEELELVFLPPNDGKDDAPSDAAEGSSNIKDIGRGVLSQSAEIRAITAEEKKDIEIDPNVLEPINTSAKLPKKRAKEDIGLKNSYHYLRTLTKFQMILINQTSQELSKIMIPVLFICLKCALMRISWNTSAMNHRSMLLQKVSHNTKYQLRNCTSILEYCSSLVM